MTMFCMMEIFFVQSVGGRDFENNQELMDNVDMEFLENVEHYYEAYKYFSLTLWLDRKLHPIELDPESRK